MLANLLRMAFFQLAASPRTVALTVAGVGVGVATFIFTVALMDGLTVFFAERILRISPTLTVLPERLEVLANREALRRFHAQELVVWARPPVPDDRPTIRGALALAQQLKNLPGVGAAAAAAPTAGILAFGTVEEAATLYGIDPEEEYLVTDLHRLLTAGSWRALSSNPQGTILGYKLAERLGVQVGDRLLATGEAGGARELEVVGVMAVGIGNWDEATALVPLPVAQTLAGWAPDEVGELRLRTGLENLEEIRQKAEALTGHRVERWEETNRAALQLFRTIGLTTYLLTGFVLVVAGLGISNKLGTIILDKEPDIAILRSYGFSRASVRALFVMEGAFLGAAGALLGCLSAFGVVSYFKAFPIRFAPREGAALAYTELYLANNPKYYLFVAALALALAVLAALVTVRRAVRVMPVEVLRGRA
jgi:lipoprotein-releasing system permease protein